MAIKEVVFKPEEIDWYIKNKLWKESEIMEKRLRTVSKFVMLMNDFAWLLRWGCKFPVEFLDAIIGIIYQNTFVVVGGCNLSINAPSEWMGEEALRKMLEVQQWISKPRASVAGYQSVMTPPHYENVWDHQKISPYSKECFLSQSGEIFLKRWMELLTQEWQEEGDDEYNPFSLAFLHNHPILRPEYLSSELRADYEAAYDLSCSSLSFAEWLKQIGQEGRLSVADKEFIRTHSTDGIGLLVLGAGQRDVAEAESVASFVTGWQVTESGTRPVPGALYNYLDSEKEYANFLHTVAEMVHTTALQAQRETSFWPAFATQSSKFLHANTENRLSRAM